MRPPGEPSHAEQPRSDGAAAPRRHLVAIVFADLCGYTLLMGRDEHATYTRWTSVCDERLVPEAKRRRGRVADIRGDGLLLEFASAGDALEWSRAAHAAMATTGDDGTEPLQMRIGIHLGDVYRRQGRLYGDVLNLAARLQEQAPPGGVIVSEAVHDLLRGTPELRWHSLGALTLKHVTTPLRAFLLSGDAPASVAAQVAAQPRPTQSAWTLPSVAVLPFRNLGPDSGDNYLAAGLIEDVGVSLAGLREMAVIARGSTIGFQDKEQDPTAAGRALGARYVVDGGMRRSGERLRVTAHLCDTETGEMLWADRADTTMEALFDTQDRLVERIVAGIAPNVRAAELRRSLRKRPESFTAYDLMLRGLHSVRSLDRAASFEGRDLLERSMREDPSFAMPIAWAAWWHSLAIGQGWTNDAAAEARRATALAERATALDPQNALALATRGYLLSRSFHEHEAALDYYDRALASGPSCAEAWTWSSGTLSYLGRGAEAVERAEHALRLSPMDQARFLFTTRLVLAHYVAGNHAEAARWGRLVRMESPGFTANLRILCAALGALGLRGEAADVASEILRCEPDFRLSSYRTTRQPFGDMALRERFMGDLARAGLPM